MLKSSTLCYMGLCIIFSLLVSCNSGSSPQFANKQDSLAFARAVIEKYPGLQAGSSLETVLQDTTKPIITDSFETAGMRPITPATIKKYSSNYDKNPPLKDPAGFFYRGFTINTAGYEQLIKNPAIQGLYLRLGMRDNGSYTIMVLGIDKEGKLLSSSTAKAPKDSIDFDFLPPCPTQCPE